MRVVLRRRAVGAVTMLLSASILGTAPSGPGPMSATSHTKKGGRYQVKADRLIAPGLSFQKIIDTKGPNRISVLRMDPGTKLTLDVELGNDAIPGHETVSSMATRRGAVAAINGDYTILPSSFYAGRPVHTFIEDAELITSPLVYGRGFALSQDETTSYLEHPRFAATITQRDSGEIFWIESWNKLPVENRYTVYTDAGGQTYPSPPNSCSARLIPSSAIRWRTPDKDGTEQDYVVDDARCAAKRMPRQGGIIVAAPIGTTKGNKLPIELAVGETVAVGWKLGWPGVVDTIGGNPNLLKDGVIVAEDCTGSYFCLRNPRTAIGVDASGNILMVTVDGRQPGYSEGLRLLPLAKLMQHLGAVSALNLDGGGSTTMWVQGRITNRVSGAYERPVGTSLLVLPAADAGEPIPLPWQQAPLPLPTMSASSTNSPTVSPSGSTSASPSLSPSPTPTGEAVPGISARPLWEILPAAPAPHPFVRPCAALHDPASTGGYLEALAAGRLGGGRRELPPVLERAVRVFTGELSCDGFLRVGR